jgi:hypothetical protein
MRPAERPVHSQPCRCARSACWEQGRSAAWPMPTPARNSSTNAVRTSCPACLRPVGASLHQRVILHTTRPAPSLTGRSYNYTAIAEQPAPTRHAAAARTGAATAVRSSCPAGARSTEASPFRWAPSGTTSQPGLIATRTLPRVSRFAPPSGKARAVDPADAAVRRCACTMSLARP